MNEPTRRALRELNRRFYRRRAQDFSASRRYPWNGWERVLQRLGDVEPFRVLDLGCGNARFATYLGQAVTRRVDYVGLDDCAELLEEARQRWNRQALPDTLSAELGQADVLEPEWPSWLDGYRFDLIVLFGVLHHVPSRRSRLGLLRRGLDHLKSGGLLACSIWRFDHQRSFPRKIVPWEHHNATARRPIDTSQLEPGDHLLTWAGDSGTPRYCHLMSGGEIAAMTKSLPLIEQFCADGPDGDHNLYLIFSRDRDPVLEFTGPGAQTVP